VASTRKANPAVIGAFVVGAAVLTVAALLIWGSRSLFEHKYEYVSYFSGSVNGLARGAPVKYQGVDVGTVKEIRVRFRQAPNDTRIPVLIELWGKRLRELGNEQEPTPEMVQALVARGLRARLATQSIVTGVLYVSLDRLPDSPISFAELPGDEALPEIPTVPTELEEATKSLSALLTHLKSADFKGMSDSVTEAASGVGQLAKMPELRAALRRFPGLVGAAHDLATSLTTDAEKTGVAVDDAREAIITLRGTLESARGVIAPRGPLAVDLTQTLSDVDKAAMAVRELADFLRRNPHAIIAGTKPQAPVQ
jgi:paraquat-inducible protein B